MRLLCSQEFIWEIELTQFIRDLKAKWKWLAFFGISVQFHGIWPFKNNWISCLAISHAGLQSSSELRSKGRMTCTFLISVPFGRTWPFQNQFNWLSSQYFCVTEKYIRDFVIVQERILYKNIFNFAELDPSKNNSISCLAVILVCLHNTSEIEKKLENDLDYFKAFRLELHTCCFTYENYSKSLLMQPLIMLSFSY